MTSSNYLTVSNAHIDSIVNYVLDVKPFHVKLSEIVEQYVFQDSFNVTVNENIRNTIFLGPDILPQISDTIGVRNKKSNSWYKDITSDGQKRIFQIPISALNKRSSHFSQEKFICGINDDTQIAGLVKGAFNQKRWDGPGITDVRLNDEYQQESLDYFLSYGVHSFNTFAGSRWKETDINSISQLSQNTGELYYADVTLSYGTISNIQNGNYEEWTIECIDSIQTMQVSGSISGIIGTFTFNSPFTHSLVSFTTSVISGDSLSDINIGDTFILTPFNKITVHPDAPEETWSLIKTNPIALASKPLFSPVIVRSNIPNLVVHTKSLDFVTEAASYTITFTTPTLYTIQKVSVSDNYVLTNINLTNGNSYKSDDIHFTLIPNGSFVTGDVFTFNVNSRVENYLVFGSISGWQQNAKIGEWYWNGKVGFKIPKLEYFATISNSTTITTSTTADDLSWNTVVSNPQILKSISFDNGSFFVAGDHSIVGASTDGTNWTSDIASTFTPGPNKFLVVLGNGGTIATSTDGITWIRQATHTNKNINATTQIPEFLTPLTQPIQPGTLNCIIAVGDSGTILTSINGIGWATQNSGTFSNLNDIAWSNGAIVTVGSNGTILTSVDRQNWTQVTSHTVNHLNAVMYDSNLDIFIAVGNNGTILKSTDNTGATWLNLGAFSDGTFKDITYGAGKYVIVGPEGWVVQSTNATTWSRYLGKKLNSIVFGNGRFVGVGGSKENLQQFMEIKPVSSIAEPSVYTITFISPTNALVNNNVYGSKHGLTIDQDWSDGIASFRIQTNTQTPFNSGDIIEVYLTPMYSYPSFGGYDDHEFDIGGYDESVLNIQVPWLFNQEYFSTYYGHGLVIFSNCNNGDTIIIDKAYADIFRLKIKGSSAKHPELLPQDDWIPVEFRYFDRVVNNIPTSVSEFSDLTTYIEGYSGANPNVKIFNIKQPQYNDTNRNAYALLEIDKTFFDTYLPFNTQYALLTLPEESYSQHIRVKFTENLKTYARVRLNFEDATFLSIVDSPVQHFNISSELNFNDQANIAIDEAGSLPIFSAYDTDFYDSIGYELDYRNGVIPNVIEIAPNTYDWTGNPEDWVMPNVTVDPSIFVDETVLDIAGASINEGLTISERNTSAPLVIERLSTFYDFNTVPLNGLLINETATEYLITHNGPSGSPSLIIESVSNPGVYGNPSASLYTFTQFPSAISLKSFIFTLPIGFTAPFRLRIV